MGFTLKESDFGANSYIKLEATYILSGLQYKEIIYIDKIIEIKMIGKSDVIERLILSQVVEVENLINKKDYSTIERIIEYPHNSKFVKSNIVV